MATAVQRWGLQTFIIATFLLVQSLSKSLQPKTIASSNPDDISFQYRYTLVSKDINEHEVNLAPLTQNVGSFPAEKDTVSRKASA